MYDERTLEENRGLPGTARNLTIATKVNIYDVYEVIRITPCMVVGRICKTIFTFQCNKLYKICYSMVTAGSDYKHFMMPEKHNYSIISPTHSGFSERCWKSFLKACPHIGRKFENVTYMPFTHPRELWPSQSHDILPQTFFNFVTKKTGKIVVVPPLTRYFKCCRARWCFLNPREVYSTAFSRLFVGKYNSRYQ